MFCERGASSPGPSPASALGAHSLVEGECAPSALAGEGPGDEATWRVRCCVLRASGEQGVG